MLRTGITANNAVLDTAALYVESTLAARPGANTVAKGTIHRSTDAAVLSLSDGTNWHPIVLDGGASPVGALQQYAGSSDPVDPDGTTRWNICDGRAISRATFATLFTAVSTAYGTGNGSTTFNLPDLRQRFPLGKATAGTGSALGNTGGTIDHGHTTPNHSHPLGAQGGAAAFGQVAFGNEWVITRGVQSQANFTAFEADALTAAAANSSFAVAGTQAGYSLIGNTESGAGGSNTGTANPPYVVVNHIIRVL